MTADLVVADDMSSSTTEPRPLEPSKTPPENPPERPGVDDMSSMPIGAEVYQGDWLRMGQGEGRPSIYIYGKYLTPIPVTTTLATVRAEFDEWMATWRGSSCRLRLHDLLVSLRPAEGWQLRDAGCLATSSFTCGDAYWHKSSFLQLAAFVDTVEYLQDTSDATIRLFAQDPVYSHLDREFISSIKVTPITVPCTWPLDNYDGHKATDHFGLSSFICEWCMNHQAWFPRALLYKGVKLLVTTLLGDATAIEKRRGRLKARVAWVRSFCWPILTVI